MVLKGAVDSLVEGAEAKKLINFALIYLGIAIFQSICRYLWRMLLIRSSFFAGRDLRNQYSNKLFSLSSSFFDRNKIGELMSLQTSDIDAMRMAMGPGLLTFYDAVFYLLTVPIAMIWLSPKLTLIVVIPLLLVPIIVIKNQDRIHKQFEKVQAKMSEISALAQEGLSGMRVVKAFTREDAQKERFKKLGKDYVDLNLKLAFLQSYFGPVLDFIMSLSLVLLVAWGGVQSIDDAITIGTFVAFQRYIEKMIWPMIAIGLSVTFYQRATASSKRVEEVLVQNSDIHEKQNAESFFAQLNWKRRGEIEARNLTFQYPGSATPALKNVSFHIQPGQRVALVGKIGSGKSTVLGLLPRLYPVNPGLLLLDGIDVNDWPIKLIREEIGFVGQDLFLFSDTVFENVKVGKPDSSVNVVESVCNSVAVHDDILTLSQGYQTRVGERGVTLSGGQKQRVTIARALIKEPSVLVLDDALSSVDVKTERTILRQLRDQRGKHTELIAAHRISTIQDSDLILVFNQGEIIQSGKHLELIREKSGLYFRLYEMQRLEEEILNFDISETPQGESQHV